MPVSTADALFNLDDYLENMSNVDVDDLYSAEPLLSEDIWKKFEFDFAELTGFNFDIIDDLAGVKPFSALDELCPIRNHDCMWAGHCGSKEHSADDVVRQPNNNHCNVSAPGLEKTPVFKTQQPVPAGRSLLLKSSIKNYPNYPAQVVHSPESPPMSDDEESKTKPTTTLQLLKDAIAECDIDEDSDLCEYFEDDCCDDEEEFGEEDVKRTYSPSENDHCYHKDKTATMRTRSLGIETPSDSEEEIDVVSVSEKFSNRAVCSLPTNPSTQDRQKLQRTVASAISNKRIHTTGIKTLLPLRKPSVDQSPIKQKIPELRGIKRTKQQYRISTPYKRRILCGHSSDSEQEPCEKRSLHNNMERQRRIDLRNAFEDLRLLIPAVNQKERAAKVAILREASKYCGELTNISACKVRQVEELRRQQERLRARVSQLRRSLAAKR